MKIGSPKRLVHSAFYKAIGSSQLGAGSVIHSDRGGQYIGKAFRRLLVKYHCRQSMSRADDPYDNAFAESYRFGAPMVTAESGIDGKWCFSKPG